MNTLLNKYLSFLDKNSKLVIVLVSLFIISFGFFLKDISFDTNWRIWYTKETLNKFDKYVDEFAYDDAVVIAFKDQDGIFTKKSIDSILRLTNKLKQIKYISKVESLTNYQYIYTNPNDRNELVIEDFIQANTNTKDLKAKKLIAKNEPNILNRLIDSKLQHTMIIAKISSEVSTMSQDPSHEIMNQIYSIIEAEKNHNNYTFYIHGGPEIIVAFEKLATSDVSLFVPLILLSIIILLYTIFRNANEIFIPLSVVVLTTIVTLSIESFLGHKLNNFTANIPLFIVAIGLADSIHIYSTYVSLSKIYTDNFEVVLNTLHKNIKPLFLTSITTAVGFYSLKFSPIEPVRLLGESIFIAVIMAFILTVLIMPIWLLKLKKYNYSNSITLNFSYINQFVKKYNYLIIVISLILVSVTMYGIKFVKIDSNLIKYFDDDVEIRKSLNFIQKNITGPVTYEILVNSKKESGIKEPNFLKTVDKFNKEILAKYPEIKNTFSLINIIKQMNKSMNGDNYYTIPTSKEEVAQYLLLYELSLPSGSNIQDLRNVNEQILKFTVQVDIVGTHKDLEILNWIENWWKQTEYSIEINGSYALFAQMQNSVSNTLIYSLYFTVLFLIVILIVSFKKIKKLYIYLLPNILPILVAFGFMGWFGISMDLGIAISAAIILSIAIDDSLHFLSKFYEYKNRGFNIEESLSYAYKYAGTAIVFTTVIVGFSFALFSFSDFTPNKYFGIVTSLSLFCALVLDLILLPALLYFSYRKSK